MTDIESGIVPFAVGSITQYIFSLRREVPRSFWGSVGFTTSPCSCMTSSNNAFGSVRCAASGTVHYCDQGAWRSVRVCLWTLWSTCSDGFPFFDSLKKFALRSDRSSIGFVSWTLYIPIHGPPVLLHKTVPAVILNVRIETKSAITKSTPFRVS